MSDGHGDESSTEFRRRGLVIALRFRDLEVANTIRDHDLILKDRDFVWWGWWHKPGEVVPRTVLSELKEEIAAEGSLDVFLVDSGHLSLLRARVLDIEVSPTEDAIDAPDQSAVPAYYAIVKRKVWFKFAEITPIDSTTIKEFAYVELSPDEFANDPAAGFFEGKRVGDIAELIQRPQTMWFLRPATSEDPAELIDLEAEIPPALPTDAQRERTKRAGVRIVGPTSPAAFMTSPVTEPSSSYFIQVSDVHFGPHHRHPLESNIPVSKSLALTLRDDLAGLYGDVPPLAIVLSGDLTWMGAVDEFNDAARFIEDLASSFKLTSRNFVIVPGNHDIRWAPEGDSYDPKRTVTASSPEAESNFRKFIEETFRFTPNDDLSMGRRFATSSYCWFDIVGLNSSRLEQRHFAGHGLVTHDSFMRAAKAMGWTSEVRKNKRRFVAMHHHLLPALPRDVFSTIDTNFSISLDAGEILITALTYETDIVMHGHMHQPVAATYSRNAAGLSFPGTRLLGVHGAGSAGLKVERLGPIGRNSYTIYEFDGDDLVVRIRALSDTIAHGYEDHAVVRFCDNELGGGLRDVGAAA